MLYHDAGLSFLHFVFAFILVGALVAEVFILRLAVDGRVAKLLTRVDAFYGLSAVLILVVGFSRAIWGAAGWEHNLAQPFFWAKIATFAAIGLLSIPPTLQFMRWNKAAKADASFVAAESEVKRTRLLVLIEVHLIALLLLFAAFMARGIGG